MKVLCWITKQSGHDRYGQPTKDKAVPEKCSIVKLKVGRTQVTLRSDTGASKGHGEEVVMDAILLLRPESGVALDDLIRVQDIDVRVMSVEPRFTAHGRLDHLQVECSVCR
jgi:hypothetical protein